MNYRELTAFLRQQGCEFRRQAKGSHEIWWSPAKRLYTTVPRSKGDLDTGTLKKILKDLDLESVVRWPKGRDSSQGRRG